MTGWSFTGQNLSGGQHTWWVTLTNADFSGATLTTPAFGARR